VRAIGAVGAPSPRLRFLAGLAEARAGRPENARAAWRALLAEAPPDAPWRPIVELQLNALP
jgi:cytochrome c-type biogenesis protein CcmH